MLTGTVMAQALPLLASPLLARLYSPEAFGLQTLFMGLAASLAVLATCRMDLAVVLPEDDSEALALVGLVALSTLAVCALTWAAVPLASALAGRALPLQWLAMLPLMVLATAVFQLATGLASRKRAFRGVAMASVANQAVYVGSALAMGFAGAWSQGLVLAKLAGQAVAALLLGRASLGEIVAAVRGWSLRASLSAARKYRQFLVFNTPYSLVGSVARDAPVYTFSALAAVGLAGFFGLARAVLLAPTLLASNAFSQVFYREAVALKGTSRLQDLTATLLRFGLLATAPLFAFCAVWGDNLFVTLFGESWRTAGVFAMALAPAAWMSVQTGWPERLFEVNMRQDASFVVQLGSDAVTALAFAGTYLLTHDGVQAVIVFAACNVLYHHVYLAAIFRISGFSAGVLGRNLLAGWLLFGACCLVLGAIRLQSGVTGAAGWVPALVLAGGLAAVIGWSLARRGLRSALAGEA
ncbi:MAG TPA: oligosaccharide flippase family protein [Ramlibacter sp.]